VPAKRRRSLHREEWAGRVFLLLLLLLVLGADAYAIYGVYVERVGNALDYYPFWAGGRAVLVQQRNPYDPAITLQTQQAIYGRPASPEENQHAYAYPAYAPFVVWPFLLLPFSVSASLWIASQQVLVVASVALAARAIGWRPGRWHLLALCLAAMTFRYSMITFVLGQTSIWILCSLALALWAVRQRQDALAGFALAAGAIKPQLVILPAVALLVSLPAPRRRRTGLALVAAMSLLLICSWLFGGNWLGDYWEQLGKYQIYSSTEFPILALSKAWLPQPLAQILNAVAVALLLGGWGLVLWYRRGTGRVALHAALSILVSQLAIPQTGSYNLVLVLVPAMILLCRLRTRNNRTAWLATAGQGLIWATLVLIPWLLRPVVQGGEWGPWDEVLVPALLLLTMLSSSDLAGVLVAKTR